MARIYHDYQIRELNQAVLDYIKYIKENKSEADAIRKIKKLSSLDGAFAAWENNDIDKLNRIVQGFEVPSFLKNSTSKEGMKLRLALVEINPECLPASEKELEKIKELHLAWQKYLKAIEARPNKKEIHELLKPLDVAIARFPVLGGTKVAAAGVIDMIKMNFIIPKEVLTEDESAEAAALLTQLNRINPQSKRDDRTLAEIRDEKAERAIAEKKQEDFVILEKISKSSNDPFNTLININKAYKNNDAVRGIEIETIVEFIIANPDEAIKFLKKITAADASDLRNFRREISESGDGELLARLAVRGGVTVRQAIKDSKLLDSRHLSQKATAEIRSLIGLIDEFKSVDSSQGKLQFILTKIEEGNIAVIATLETFIKESTDLSEKPKSQLLGLIAQKRLSVKETEPESELDLSSAMKEQSEFRILLDICKKNANPFSLVSNPLVARSNFAAIADIDPVTITNFIIKYPQQSMKFLKVNPGTEKIARNFRKELLEYPTDGVVRADIEKLDLVKKLIIEGSQAVRVAIKTSKLFSSKHMTKAEGTDYLMHGLLLFMSNAARSKRQIVKEGKKSIYNMLINLDEIKPAGTKTKYDTDDQFIISSIFKLVSQSDINHFCGVHPKKAIELIARLGVKSDISKQLINTLGQWDVIKHIKKRILSIQDKKERKKMFLDLVKHNNEVILNMDKNDRPKASQMIVGLLIDEKLTGGKKPIVDRSEMIKILVTLASYQFHTTGNDISIKISMILTKLALTADEIITIINSQKDKTPNQVSRFIDMILFEKNYLLLSQIINELGKDTQKAINLCAMIVGMKILENDKVRLITNLCRSNNVAAEYYKQKLDINNISSLNDLTINVILDSTQLQRLLFSDLVKNPALLKGLLLAGLKTRNIQKLCLLLTTSPSPTLKKLDKTVNQLLELHKTIDDLQGLPAYQSYLAKFDELIESVKGKADVLQDIIKHLTLIQDIIKKLGSTLTTDTIAGIKQHVGCPSTQDIDKFITDRLKILTTALPAETKSATKATVSEVEPILDLNVYPKMRINVDKDHILTMGDMHGNALKLIHILILHNTIDIDKKDYQKLVDIHNELPILLDKAKFDEFDRIIDSIKVINKEIFLKFLGDLLADRGPNDYFKLKVLDKLHSLGIEFEILWSNHDIEFMQAFDKLELKAGVLTSLQKNQDNSMKNLRESILAGFVSIDKVKDIYNRVYKPSLTFISYQISDKHDAILIDSHALIGIDTIQALAAQFSIPYRDDTVDDLAKTIDAINSHVNKNFTQLLSKPSKDIDDAKTRNDNPFDAVTWNRTYEGLQRPVLHKGYKLFFDHGHHNIDENKPNISNLDNSWGKSRNEFKAKLSEAGFEVRNSHTLEVVKPVFITKKQQESNKEILKPASIRKQPSTSTEESDEESSSEEELPLSEEWAVKQVISEVMNDIAQYRSQLDKDNLTNQQKRDLKILDKIVNIIKEEYDDKPHLLIGDASVISLTNIQRRLVSEILDSQYIPLNEKLIESDNIIHRIVNQLIAVENKEAFILEKICKSSDDPFNITKHPISATNNIVDVNDIGIKAIYHFITFNPQYAIIFLKKNPGMDKLSNRNFRRELIQDFLTVDDRTKSLLHLLMLDPLIRDAIKSSQIIHSHFLDSTGRMQIIDSILGFINGDIKADASKDPKLILQDWGIRDDELKKYCIEKFAEIINWCANVNTAKSLTKYLTSILNDGSVYIHIVEKLRSNPVDPSLKDLVKKMYLISSNRDLVNAICNDDQLRIKYGNLSPEAKTSKPVLGKSPYLRVHSDDISSEEESSEESSEESRDKPLRTVKKVPQAGDASVTPVVPAATKSTQPADVSSESEISEELNSILDGLLQSSVKRKKAEAVVKYVMLVTNDCTDKNAYDRPFDHVSKLDKKPKREDFEELVLKGSTEDKKIFTDYANKLKAPFIPSNENERFKMLQQLFKLYDSFLDEKDIKECLPSADKLGGHTQNDVYQRIIRRYLFLMTGDVKVQPSKIIDVTPLDQWALHFMKYMIPVFADFKSNNVDINNKTDLLGLFDKHLNQFLIGAETNKINFFNNITIVNSHQNIIRVTGTDSVIVSITALLDQYKDSKRKTHLSDFDNLKQALSNIDSDDKYKKDPIEKYKAIIAQVELAFEQAVNAFTKPFLSIGPARTFDDYVEKISSSQSSYQYPKLLAKILNDAYTKNPDLVTTKNQKLSEAVGKIVASETQAQTSESTPRGESPKQ